MNKLDFFDNWEYKQIFTIAEHDLVEAINYFEKYFEKYPKDYSQYPYYISYLSTIGDFEKAQEKMEYIIRIVNEDTNFKKNKEKLINFEKNILFTKVKLLANLEKYEKVLKILEPHFEDLEEYGFVGIYFYSQIKNGTLIKKRDELNTYLFRQMIEYDENDFLDHIQKHMPDHNADLDNPNKNIFSTDFPLDEILEEIKKYIPSDKQIHHGFFDSRYFFKYDNCGRVNNKITNYFVVSCFNNTPNIITMCPSNKYQFNNYVDLNYIRKNKYTTKSRRLSQIDKFNQRYNKK